MNGKWESEWEEWLGHARPWTFGPLRATPFAPLLPTPPPRPSEVLVSVVQPNSHVTVEYVLKDDEGEILDASNARGRRADSSTCTATGCSSRGSRPRLSGSRRATSEASPSPRTRGTASDDEELDPRDRANRVSGDRPTGRRVRGHVARRRGGRPSRRRGERRRRARGRKPPARGDDAPLRDRSEVDPRGDRVGDRRGRARPWTRRTSTCTAPTATTITPRAEAMSGARVPRQEEARQLAANAKTRTQT